MFEERTIEFSDAVTMELEEHQKFIPIYPQFYQENERNNFDLTLNYEIKLDHLEKESDTYNSFIGKTENDQTIPVFIKFCPLVDPTKVLMGKLQYSDFSIPKPREENHVFSDKNNSAYVDSFFTFLTSQMLHRHGFKNALDCYGSYMAMKKNYRFDIVDDIEYLFECDYFMKHREEFKISDDIYDQFEPSQSSKYKKKIKIEDGDAINIVFDEIDEPPSDVTLNTTTLCMLDAENQTLIYEDRRQSEINEGAQACDDDKDDSSSLSSRSSATTIEELCDSLSESEDYDMSEPESVFSSTYEEEEEEPIYATLEKMPTNMVLLEACKDTLDDYIMMNDVGPSEWSAILMQIVMTLVVFQEKFLFVHNDLHSSNVMYVPTEKQYIYYRYNNQYYKVPTYGKIWKIIDFGRAIYKFKGRVIFSDSFSEKGDASTQYNCEPYLNPKKQIVPPNFSFDLCRLACSLFDFFEEDESELAAIKEVVIDWMMDDKGRNILYKKNGDERYENFKLYKMISRTVHRHLPKEQLSRKIFAQYLIPRKNIKKKMNDVMKIDDIPDYHK